MSKSFKRLVNCVLVSDETETRTSYKKILYRPYIHRLNEARANRYLLSILALSSTT